MHFVIFDPGEDLAFGASRFFAQSVIFEVTLDPNRELRITQWTSVLHLDERLVAMVSG